MAENQTQPTGASVDDFIAAVENPQRRADAQAALELYKEVTGLPPVMWGPAIIGFGQIRYAYGSGRTGIMPRTGFSPRKANMTFYIDGHFAGANSMFERLGKHKRSIACLYVNKLDDIDVQVLREIIAADFGATQSG